MGSNFTRTPQKSLWQAHSSSSSSWIAQLDSRISSLERTEHCFRLLDADPMLECKLPRKVTSGFVIKHAYSVVETLISQKGPLVFKFGWTHCPTTRLRNKKFGYINEKQNWEKMLVLFASWEAVGPGFLESALIQKYKGSLFVFCKPFDFESNYALLSPGLQTHSLEIVRHTAAAKAHQVAATREMEGTR